MRREDCQSPTAVREVLAGLIMDTSKILETRLKVDDFVDPFHKILYSTLFNLARSGITNIDIPAIESYLSEHYPAKYYAYKKYNGRKYLQNALELMHPGDFSKYYEELRKYSMIRDFMDSGIDVSDFYNPDEIDVYKADTIADKFNHTPLLKIGEDFKLKVLKILNSYDATAQKNSIKAGGQEAKDRKLLWNLGTSYGLSYASNYLTGATDGLHKGRLTIASAATNTAKSRLTLANIAHTFAVEFYNEKTKEWEKNPNGQQNSVLYIGTEQDPREELEPVLEAYLAAVPQDHIMHPNLYLPGEEERVDYAIDVLTKSQIYMEYLPDYSLATLEETISRHVLQNKVNHVFFDYIHTTASLMAEYNRTMGADGREDQILANVGNHLKNWAKAYDISIDTATQVNGDFGNLDIRDQRLIRG